MTALSLAGIAIYPLKSAAGIQLARSVIDRFGLCYDRRWMLVDRSGCFITQRRHHQLCRVTAVPSPDGLEVGAPGFPSLTIARPDSTSPQLNVEVWNDRCEALDCGGPAADWFSRLLGLPARLVYMPDTSVRAVSRTHAPEGGTVGFADGYPLLLVCQASLDDLNGRLEQPIPMSRFRPNLVVGGGRAFQEDGWSRIRIGDQYFKVVKPCERCIMTTIDPALATPAKEPLATLSRYRRFDNKVLFGQNLVQETTGQVSLGDPVEVLA